MLGLAALLVGLFSVVLGGSRQAVVQTSEALRQAAIHAVAERVQSVLAEAEVAVTDVETDLERGLLDVEKPDAVEAALFALLLRHPDLVEASWTYGKPSGYGSDDRIVLAPSGRGQIAVERTRDGRLITRHIHEYEGGWALDVRPRAAGAGLLGAELARTAYVPADPTEHPTFWQPASQNHRGQTLWSDLAFSELDEALPEMERRKEMSVQKAVFNPEGRFVGVARAGLVSDEIDRAGQLRVVAKDDPSRIFICDRAGRLVSKLHPDDTYAEMDGDVRVVPAHPDPAISTALHSSALGDVSPDRPALSTMRAGGIEYFVTITQLPDDKTLGWLVGVVAPSSYYLHGLDATRDRLILLSALIAAAVLVGGWLALRALRGGLGQVVAETRRIQRFDFDAGGARATFAEVNDALGSLEVAKAALRAMGRYVPIELVRLLFRAGKEPELGGAPRDVSMLFTDIEGFTTFSEKMAPNELAAALGRYLEVVTEALRASGGTIDKFIGDSVMVIWNAPLDVADHARRACEAALACQRALADLYASPEWDGRPPWVTRFGLHRDTVLVGHFGAPHRMSYTALGDGVNLASRIEGQNKAYGTTILVSETIRDGAGDGFLFRRVDRVAVVGKTRSVELFELLGARGEVEATVLHRSYEAALERYFAGRFAEAAALLAGAAGDPPSRVLRDRCEALVAAPPTAWDGVYHAAGK